MIDVIILAAGKGVRMKSDLPKVFHKILEKPMLSYVLEAAKSLDPKKIFLVVGYKKEIIMDYYKDWPITFVIQNEQLGTGHAVMQVEPHIKEMSGDVLVLNGDIPLITSATLSAFLNFHKEKRSAATVLTAVLEDPSHYGRIVRNENGRVLKIVEKKDASKEELEIKEINTGVFCFKKSLLFSALKEVKCENVQKEYYLTDTLEILKKKELPVFAFRAKDPTETLGVNNRDELLEIEKKVKSSGAE